MMRSCSLLLLVLLLGQALTVSQQASKDGPSWDVAAQHAPTREVSFETDEGTWMSVDVSPDGRQIVFDLLGDIYIMPISGGTATLLSGGTPYETQPRFSPDGTRISFTSDRGGGDNIWVMDRNGRNRHAVTKENFRLLNNAVWTPDGHFLIARKHFVNTRSLGAGEMWMYHTSGGEGVQLTKRRNWQQNAGEPALSPDGRYLYYSEDVSPGNQFEYNRDPYGEIYVINRLDRETGKVNRFIAGNGGSVRPQVSPDGKLVAFVRRVRLNSVLYLHNIETGEEWPLFDGLSRDAQETWAIFGVYPGYSWTPDGKWIVVYGKGKLWKVDAATGASTLVPFTVRSVQTVTETVRFPQEVSPGQFDVKMLRWVTVAPDGRSVVYNALGHLWTKQLPDGTPRRLTSDAHFEFYPSFSRDGRWIVYTTWSDTEKGAVYKVRSTGGTGTRLTTVRGTYVEPSFSADGTRIAFVKVGGDALRGQAYGTNPGIYQMPADGGTAQFVTEEGSSPFITQNGDRIFLNSSEDGKPALVSVDLNGSNRRVHLLSENAQEIVPSPNGQWVAFTERFNSYVTPLPMTGQAVHTGPSSSAMPLRRLTRDAGTYLHWSPDSKTVYWSLGPQLYSRRLDHAFAFMPGAPDSISAPDTAGIPIGFRAATDHPEGITALVGGRAVTMRGDEVIENATVLVRNNRIAAVGARDTVVVPKEARIVDVTGKTIIPGLIDVHAHGPAASRGITPQQNWAFFANLAYGVTTEHDPSNSSEEVFAASEMLKAGIVTGPRLFSTGLILYGAEGSIKAVVDNIDDARSHLRRLKALGAFTVKSYNQPRRDQRQQIVEAAREMKLMVVPEGGSTLFWNVTQILDGHTGIEHAIPVAPLYKDVVTLLAQSGTAYTPTLIVGYGGLWGENYWYAESNVWENKRLLSYIPRSIIDARSRRRMKVHEEDWNHVELARSAAKVLEAGGKVQLGAHGQLQGLGAHWELWMLAQGGMTPLQALRCATLYGAQYIGLDRDLGSLEPGKLADLVVLDRNPLENIRNSESVNLVMVNGRLYDAATMNRIGASPERRAAFFWEGGKDPGTALEVDTD